MNAFVGASLLAILAATPALAEEGRLGRLFFSPEERASLDLERLTGVAGAGGAQSVRLDGITRNQGTGGHTVWLNGQPWHGAGRLTGVVPGADPATATVRSAEGEPMQVRVGEAADRVSGLKYAPLAPGAVVVHRK